MYCNNCFSSGDTEQGLKPLKFDYESVITKKGLYKALVIYGKKNVDNGFHIYCIKIEDNYRNGEIYHLTNYYEPDLIREV